MNNAKLSRFVREMISSLEHYFGKVEECEPLAYATYLDPRYKDRGFVDTNAADCIKEKAHSSG